MDRIRAWGAGNDADPTPTERSPLERKLIERLQELLGDPAREQTPLRLRLRFTGEVQGVGFRWNNTWIARDIGITGWVCNLDDGSVLMEVQGTPRQIIRHLDEIHAYYQRFRNRIWLESEVLLAAVDGEGQFEARYEPGIDL
ncbi:acylphosphatase [Collinsella tanakaei]|nr:acylphosphatase [Collinsella tanakaei]